MKSNNESNKALASQIREALSKTKPKEFHFHYPGEAWKFQMAVVFKWLLSGFGCSCPAGDGGMALVTGE